MFGQLRMNASASAQAPSSAKASVVSPLLASLTRSTAACSKRPRMSAIGSSIVVMPATEIGPGMMRTESAE